MSGLVKVLFWILVGIILLVLIVPFFWILIQMIGGLFTGSFVSGGDFLILLFIIACIAFVIWCIKS